MGRPMKKKDEDEAEADAPSTGGSGLLVQSRTRRTIKPNPKYNSKEMVMPRRGSSSDDDEEMHDNTEDDEDFQDDGKDTDEEQPRKRGRVKDIITMAPRSEPPPAKKFLQARQMSIHMPGSAPRANAMAASAAAAAALRKRKINFEGGDSDAIETEPKKRITNARISSRLTNNNNSSSSNSSPTPATKATVTSSSGGGGEKENVLMQKKGSGGGADIVFVNINDIMNKNNNNSNKPTEATVKKTAELIAGRGVTTRRTIGPSSTITTTASHLTNKAAGATAVTSPAKGREEPDSLIQVRRTTPINNAVVSRLSGSSGVTVKSPLGGALNSSSSTATTTPTTTPVRMLRGANSSQVANVSLMKRVVAPATAAVAAVNRSQPKSSAAAAAAHNNNTSGGSTNSSSGTATVTAAAKVAAAAAAGEKQYVLKMPPEETALSRQRQAATASRCLINLVSLANEIKTIRLPNERWSYQMSLIKLPPDSKRELVYHGKQAKGSFDVRLIQFHRVARPNNGLTGVNRRKQQPAKEEASAAAGAATVEHDRMVQLQNRQFSVRVDDKEVRLVAAPESVNNLNEVETLLQIVDHVSLHSSVVEVNHLVE